VEADAWEPALSEDPSLVRRLYRRYAPGPARGAARRAVERWRTARWRRPQRLGSLRRLTPVDDNWGFARGGPVDRVYIARFLERHSSDIQGRVLEVADDDYVRRFGTRVTGVDILDAAEGNPKATLVADLTDAPAIPDSTYDCVILTQVLQVIWDVPAALRTAHRILVPGGVLLATVPGICKISTPEAQAFGDWWRFTSMSAARLAEAAFGAGAVEVETYGNVLAAVGFLHGLGEWDLRPDELEVHDPDYQVTIGIRGVKRG
jgi:SAM-dependent methyltransferase